MSKQVTDNYEGSKNMEKKTQEINCDIIQDLIPLYLDEVCTEATSLCVQEHLENCSSCRRLAALCKDNSLSGSKLEQKSLDGLKKIKKRLNYQYFIYCLIIALLTFSAYCAFINTAFLSRPAHLALFTICILMTLLIGTNYKDAKSPGRAEYILGLVSFSATVYIILMLLYFTRNISVGLIPFGLVPEQCGPFLVSQFIITFIIQFATFIYYFIRTVKYSVRCSWLLCLNITGISLAQQYAFCLHSMDTIENFQKILSRYTLLTVIIGLIGIIICLPITKYLPKKRR